MGDKSRMTTERVIEYFKDNVMKGNWKAGDKLPTEPELCELVGVGRSSVREAMKILESSHVVEIRRGDGTYISEPDKISFIEPLLFKVVLKESKMQEMIGFRESIELAVMRLAICNAEPEDIEELERCNQKIYRYIQDEKDDAEELFALDMEFHKILSQAVHNVVMGDIYQFTFDIFGPVILQNYRSGQTAQSALDTHLALTEALKSKDFLQMGFAIRSSVELWGTWGGREKVSDYLKENHLKL